MFSPARDFRAFLASSLPRELEAKARRLALLRPGFALAFAVAVVPDFTRADQPQTRCGMANEEDGERLCELLTAAHRGDLTRVGELHAAGADLGECDGEGWSALIEAAKGGQLDMTRELLRRGAKPNPIQVGSPSHVS